MKRIFIALKIKPEAAVVNMLLSFRSVLKEEKIKWTEIDNLHITLAFLGDTEESKVKAIDKMLKRVCEGSGEFEIALKGAGVFKNIRDPRVIWTGIEPSEKLNRLHDIIKVGMTATGIIIRDRNFSPHITLGRIRKISDSSGLRSLIDRYDDTEIMSQTIMEVILYESILYPAGPVYKPLGIYPLLHLN